MSIIWVMRSMPSVVMLRTCVSPRLNSAEPCARVSTPTSAESGRISVGVRPSRRIPSSITRLRMTFFWTCFQAATELAHAVGGGVAQLGGRVLLGLRLQRVELGLALGLVGHDRLGEPVLREARNDVVEVVPEEGARFPRLLGHSGGVDERLLEVDLLLDRTLGGLETLGDDLLGRGGRAGREQLPGVVGRLALDHQDVDLAGVVSTPGHDHVERGLLDLLEGRVRDPLSVDQTHADRADRTVEGQAGQAGRDRRGVHRQDVVRVPTVDAQHRDDDLDLVPVPIAEGRAQRAVDEPACEDRRLGRPSLATEEAAGDLPRRVHPLLDVDREREEIDPLAGRGADAGGEHLGLAVRHHDGAVGEAGHLARLEGHGAGPDLTGHGGGHRPFLLAKTACGRSPEHGWRGWVRPIVSGGPPGTKSGSSRLITDRGWFPPPVERSVGRPHHSSRDGAAEALDVVSRQRRRPSRAIRAR